MNDSESTFPRTTNALRTALEQAGIRVKKRHGQCFLTDAQAVDAIVRDAKVEPSDLIVEVGTGPGLLTDVLASTGATVHTFEIDDEVQAFATSAREWPDSVHFHLGDVLASKHRLSPKLLEVLELQHGGRTRMIANLPYAIATPLIQCLLSLPRPPADLHVMIQREVAEKMLAHVGADNYGAPSVGVQLRAEGRILRRFGPEVFWPPPKIRSVILHLVPRQDMPLKTEEQLPFLRFVTRLFTRRRKLLPSGVSYAAEIERAIVRDRLIELDPTLATLRPQDLSPAQALAVWRTLSRR